MLTSGPMAENWGREIVLADAYNPARVMRHESPLSAETDMNAMRQLTLAAALFVVLASTALAQAEKVDPSKLPPKVAAALKARFPGATVTQVTKETENGAVVYDIEMTKDGKKHEMDCKED